jgi:hypothetical protein
MDDVGLADYIAGITSGPVEAGRVDAQCSRFLRVPCGTVIWFSNYTFIKLEAKHGEINFSHYRHMPSILLHGFLATGRKPRLLDLWWVQPDGGFSVVLKATSKNEVFVTTFHPIHLKEARRLFRRARDQGRLIRVQRDACSLLKIEEEVA